MPGAAPLRGGSDVRASRRVTSDVLATSVGYSYTTTRSGPSVVGSTARTAGQKGSDATQAQRNPRTSRHVAAAGHESYSSFYQNARVLAIYLFTNTRRATIPRLRPSAPQTSREVQWQAVPTLRTNIASRHVSRSLVRTRSLSLSPTRIDRPPALRYLARSRNAAPIRRRDRRAPAAPPPVLAPTRTPLQSPAGPPHLSRPPRPRAPCWRYGAAPRRHSAPSAAARSPARPRPPQPKQTRRGE